MHINLQLCQQWVLQVKWAIGSMCPIGRLGRCPHCRGLCNGDNILRNGWKLFLPKCQSGWASSLLAVPALFLDVSSLLERKKTTTKHFSIVDEDHGKPSDRLTIPEPKPNTPWALSNSPGYFPHLKEMSSQMSPFKFSYMGISVTATITAWQYTARDWNMGGICDKFCWR